MNIGFLIPSTSKNRNWNSVKDSYLYKFTLSTLKISNNYTFIIYIGFDHDDDFYTNLKNQKDFKQYFPNFIFKFIPYDKTVEKGHLTKMWNILYYNAMIDDNFFIDYFYQCGDDIAFKTNGWLEKSIESMTEHHGIGISGPFNEHTHMLTQTLISRKHYDIFGFLFPENILNWGCDDWLNSVYLPNLVYPINNELAINSGGPPRYNISGYNEKNIKRLANNLANNDKHKLNQYLQLKKMHFS